MNPEHPNVNRESVQEPEPSRVGTWISLGITGGVILLTYVVLYGLYMIRH